MLCTSDDETGLFLEQEWRSPLKYCRLETEHPFCGKLSGTDVKLPAEELLWQAVQRNPHCIFTTTQAYKSSSDFLSCDFSEKRGREELVWLSKRLEVVDHKRLTHCTAYAATLMAPWEPLVSCPTWRQDDGTNLSVHPLQSWDFDEPGLLD